LQKINKPSAIFKNKRRKFSMAREKLRLIEDEMRESYLDYSMSVIVGRALPDLRDGLKPVHRRILYAMSEMGLIPERPFKKSARVVGEVLGKFHPHGDQAVYDSLVRMAQPFSMRHMLVRGQGNFGSVDGDRAAAMRYTETKLSKVAMEIIKDIDMDTVDFQPNFDNSLEEPIVLPSRFPNLLVNGSSGIAVGMATNIPPHNLNEVCRAISKYIENPEVSEEELLEVLPGPDFPTGGEIYGDSGIKLAYKTGKGKLTVRGKTRIEEDKNGEAKAIIIEEIPYMVNKTLLIEDISKAVKAGIIKQVSGLNDESDREGMRLVVTLKKGANVDVLLNQLYKHTRLQTTFGIIIIGLVDNYPKQVGLKGLLKIYVDHRLDIVKRRSQFELIKAKDRLHILDGLRIALKHIDAIIALIKGSKSPAEAHSALMSEYSLSEKQASSILDMKLSRLTALEQRAVEDEYLLLTQRAKELEAILASQEKQLSIISDEIELLQDKYGEARRTKILQGDFDQQELDYEALIEEHIVVITKSHNGYIKRVALDEYRAQARGGRGITAGKLHDDDFMDEVFVTSTHSYILCFSNRGKVYWLRGFNIPEASRLAKGTHIRNLLELSEGEKLNAVIPIREFDSEHYLTFFTKQGRLKKTSLKAYSNPRRGGIIAINLNEGDDVEAVLHTDGKQELIVASAEGKAVRFREAEARPMGRNAAGVKAISLRKSDRVIGAVVVEPQKTLLTVTRNGYGKRTLYEDYSTIHRGGKGVINIKTTERNGNVVGIKSVTNDDQIILISTGGIMIRMAVDAISIIGRNTQGVRLMRLEEGTRVASIGKIQELE
jgi:DNA gyrase subunit A